MDVQFSPDGRLLLSSSLDGTARLWEASTGASITVLKAGGLRSALFSPDGSLVLTGSEDGALQLWRPDGTRVGIFSVPDGRISAATFSPDGRLVAAGTFDGEVQLWSIASGSLITTFKSRGGLLSDIEFSQNGQYVVAAFRDGTALIWPLANGTKPVVLRGHDGAVSSAAFSPSGLYVVTTSSEDRTVRLWAAESGRQVAILAGQEDRNNAVSAPTRAAFSSDGTRIAILSGEQSVRIVRTFRTAQDLIDFAHNIVPRELTPCERRGFFLPVEGDVGDCPS